MVTCGRRWGKTATGLMATVRGHGPRRGTFRGALDGATVWWVGQNYTSVKRQIWPDLKRALVGAWTIKSEVDHYIRLPNGGSVTVKSADNPDSLRGFGLDGVVVDEAAFCREPLWSEVLRPMLLERNGWAMFISTPNGPNWFFRLFQRAFGDGWERWQRPTRDNPLITPQELEAARLQTGPRAYAQEYDAQFAEEEGALFPVEYFPDSMWFDAHEWPADDRCLRVVACDPSMGRGAGSDYSAIVAVAQSDGGYFVRADLEKRPPSQIVADCLRTHRQFRPHGIGFETLGFQQLLKDEFDRIAAQLGMDVAAYGLGCGPVVGKIDRIVGRLDPLLAARALRFLRGDRGTELLVEQLRGFPLAGYHDDGPDALEMAVRLLESRPWLGPEREVQVYA